MPLPNLLGKVAIITGGSQGVGASVVKSLLGQGARVSSIDLVHQSAPSNPNFIALQCDVSDEQQVNHAIDQVINKWGKIDILVNNAGITDDNKGVSDTPMAVWRRVTRVNLDGPMFLMRGVIPHMLKNEAVEKGSIVNVCSIAAVRGAAAGAAYTTAKHALLGLSRNTAWMYHHNGIRCNSVLPGGINTNIIQNSGNMIDLEKLGPLAPFMNCSPGVCEPEQVADAIMFLATSEGVNGAELTVDKGWTVA